MKPIEKLRAAMHEKNIDAVLVTDELNQRYLTGFPFTDGYVLVLSDTAYLITDFRYREGAEKGADAAFTVETPKPMLGFMEETLRREGVKTLGYEDETLPMAAYKRFADYFSVSLSPIGDLFLSLRSVKDEEEIACIAEAQRITDAAFSHITDILVPDMTENEVALELEFFMRKNGAEKVSFDTIAVSGTQSALPHGTPRDVTLERGFLTMDFGCIYRGYCSDMTRTVSVGEATDEMRRLYDTVLKAQTDAIAALRPGITGYDADKVARDVIEGAGYHGAFGHSLGHGVGMFIHEEPRLSPSAKSLVLVPGHVVTAEPGIYLPGKYGCRIEDLIVITENGCRDLTQSPKNLIEIL